jgi:hypothetical protein
VPSAITSLLEGGFDLKLLDEDEALSHSFTIARSRTANSSSMPEEQMKSAFNPEVMENDSDDGIDAESIKAVTKGLVLDQGVDTNLFAFVLHGCKLSHNSLGRVYLSLIEILDVSWANQFIFEPCQTFSETKNNISLWIKQDPRLARSMSHTGLVLSRSTEYDLTDYEVLEQALVESVVQARARGSKGAEAMMAIAHSHKVTCRPLTLNIVTYKRTVHHNSKAGQTFRKRPKHDRPSRPRLPTRLSGTRQRTR